jgi:hypothetical protein
VIHAKEKALSFDGYPADAYRLVASLRLAFFGEDMPKMLNDFVFNIEVQLQNIGFLDQDFNLVGEL